MAYSFHFCRLFNGLDEVMQRYWFTTTNIVDGIGWVLMRYLWDNTHQSIHDVINVGEVSAEVSVVVHVDGISFNYLIGEFEQSHIWSSKRSVHRKKAETRHREAVDRRVAVGHRFVCFFGRGVQTHLLVGSVFFRKRHLIVGSIHG